MATILFLFLGISVVTGHWLAWSITIIAVLAAVEHNVENI